MEAREIAAYHLETVREKVAELSRLERSLAEFIRECDGACAGGPDPDRAILRNMAAPAVDKPKRGNGRKAR